MSIFSSMVKYSRLVLGLREFLHGTISLEESIQVLQNRLRDRERNFLALVQKGIFQNPRNPYLKMLRIAGCEFGDIELSVKRDGIEPTLQKLLAKGVYLSWEEFKVKREFARGGSHFQFQERDFDNPFLPVYYQIQSSGSRSAGTRTTFDLTQHIEMCYYRLPMLSVNNCLDIPLGIWKPVLPSVSGISNVLSHWKVGKPIVRWFSPVDERQVQASFRDRLAMRYILWGSWLWGAKLPRPEYVGLEDAVIVAQWMEDTKRQFGGCLLSTSPSLAVKVCQAATEKGLDIRSTHFIVSGEPLTENKRQKIESTGVSVSSRYYISEIGAVGNGCLSLGGDDVHLLFDSVAAIQHLRRLEHADTYVNAFLYTPLSLSSPNILLNLESDDYGVMETRRCGCLFEQIGFTQHLHDIRSFTKLTGSGMTIIGSAFIRILEEVLPGKYGGGPVDYQLLEEENNLGQTRLSLVISPAVGAIDEGDVIATVLSELRKGAHGGKLAAGLWSQANTICIKRMYPISKFGKVMTLHQMKR